MRLRRGGVPLGPIEFEDPNFYGEAVVLEAEPGIAFVGTDVLVTVSSIEVACTVPGYAELENDLLVGNIRFSYGFVFGPTCSNTRCCFSYVFRLVCEGEGDL